MPKLFFSSHSFISFNDFHRFIDDLRRMLSIAHHFIVQQLTNEKTNENQTIGKKYDEIKWRYRAKSRRDQKLIFRFGNGKNRIKMKMKDERKNQQESVRRKQQKTNGPNWTKYLILISFVWNIKDSVIVYSLIFAMATRWEDLIVPKKNKVAENEQRSKNKMWKGESNMFKWEKTQYESSQKNGRKVKANSSAISVCSLPRFFFSYSLAETTRDQKTKTMRLDCVSKESAKKIQPKRRNSSLSLWTKTRKQSVEKKEQPKMEKTETLKWRKNSRRWSQDNKKSSQNKRWNRFAWNHFRLQYSRLRQRNMILFGRELLKRWHDKSDISLSDAATNRRHFT